MHRLKKIISSLTPQPEQSLNTLLIHQQRLLDNLAFLQSLHKNQSVFPVLKSNAYGHGLKEVSTLLKNTSVDYICVDSFPEYQIVKDYATKKSLILGETHPENYAYYDPRRATPAVYRTETLKFLWQTNKPRTIHLFLNTGMNREWIQAHELKEFLGILKLSPNITLEWVMSHFASADEIDSSFDLLQIEAFKKMYEMIEQHPAVSGKPITYRHINNSAWWAKYHDPFFNAHRAWLAFYGYNPLQENDPAYGVYTSLQPALSVTSTVTTLQQLKQNDIVSYGAKRRAEKQCETATVPFGYYEWLPRKLTNNWSVKWNDTYLPLIGTICMNLSCLDTLSCDIHIGDTVEIISSEHTAPNNIIRFAEKIETIPYEVLVKLNEKVRRVTV